MDIGDVECMVLFYLFERSVFLWLLVVCDRLCGCVPCLRYPRKGNTPRVYYYYYYYYILLLLLLFIYLSPVESWLPVSLLSRPAALLWKVRNCSFVFVSVQCFVFYGKYHVEIKTQVNMAGCFIVEG